MAENLDFSTMTADEIGKVLRDSVNHLNLLQGQAARYGASLWMELFEATSFGDQSRWQQLTVYGPGARSAAREKEPDMK